MQLHFVGRNIELTDAIKDYATTKLKPLAKRYNHITTINVALHVEHTTHIAEAVVHAGTEIHASAKSDDMYKAIDELADKLLTQITKYKDKMIDQHR